MRLPDCVSCDANESLELVKEHKDGTAVALCWCCGKQLTLYAVDGRYATLRKRYADLRNEE